jgi:hypothetical protein
MRLSQDLLLEADEIIPEGSVEVLDKEFIIFRIESEGGVLCVRRRLFHGSGSDRFLWLAIGFRFGRWRSGSGSII